MCSRMEDVERKGGYCRKQGEFRSSREGVHPKIPQYRDGALYEEARESDIEYRVICLLEIVYVDLRSDRGVYPPCCEGGQSIREAPRKASRQHRMAERTILEGCNPDEDKGHINGNVSQQSK